MRASKRGFRACFRLLGLLAQVPEPQVVEAVTQVVRPVVEVVGKEVPLVVTEPVEKLQEVVQRPLLAEVAVAVPQLLTYEQVRQEAEPAVEQHLRQVPKAWLRRLDREGDLPVVVLEMISGLAWGTEGHGMRHRGPWHVRSSL